MSAPKIVKATDDVGELVVEGGRELATEVFEQALGYAGEDTGKAMSYAIGMVGVALVMLAKTVGPEVTLAHMQEYLGELWAVLKPDSEVEAEELFGNLLTGWGVGRGDA